MEEVNSNIILRERFKLLEKELLYEGKVISIFQTCYFCHKPHHFLSCPEKFPQFPIDTKNEEFLRETESDLARYPRPRTNTLKYYRELETIRKFKNTENYKMIVKVEKRLLKIRKKLNIRSREFEIDAAHDWRIFEPHWNLSNLKESWNARIGDAEKNWVLIVFYLYFYPTATVKDVYGCFFGRKQCFRKLLQVISSIKKSASKMVWCFCFRSSFRFW